MHLYRRREKVRQIMEGKVKVKVRVKLEWKRKAKVKLIRLILIKVIVTGTRFRALQREKSMTRGCKMMQEARKVKMKATGRGR